AATWLCLALCTQAVRAESPDGALLYAEHCASCHHAERIGMVGPPLVPLALSRSSDDQLKTVIRQGLPSTQMGGFPHFTPGELEALVAFLRRPAQVEWSSEDIRNSFQPAGASSPPPPAPSRLENLTAVVERGSSLIWMMEGQRVLDRFAFGNVHGGLKFSPDGAHVYVPSRDGWVGRYDVGQGYRGRIRASIFLRNLAVSRDGRYVLVASWMPSGIQVLDAGTLEPVKTLPVEGKISAIYELDGRDEAVFTLRDRPVLGVLSTRTLEIAYRSLDEPLEDFFLDPLERFAVGTARQGTRLRAIDLTGLKTVFEHPVEGLPHLASAAFWYDRGQFYAATTHIQAPTLSVWRLYDWALIGQIPIGGNGFFVRTHPETPYLWIDNGSQDLVLVEKRTLQVSKRGLGARVVHTEFSGDGGLAYVSLSGALVMLDAATLVEAGRLQANSPVGKYNFVTKQRRYEPVLLGRQVYMERCWGCHHPTREAFGPSLAAIFRRRPTSDIWAQILNPEGMHARLGYRRNAMPRLELKPEEIEALISYMKEQARAAHQ
ncbi:MAG: cytochrome D1 domain-containing protein, partial [Candidatus Eremiobacterota bacterium]